jgi:hypothetical protein
LLSRKKRRRSHGAALWAQVVLRLFPSPVCVNGRLVMPAVKLLHQQSESNTKACSNRVIISLPGSNPTPLRNRPVEPTKRQAEEGGTQALRQKDKAQVAVFRYPSNEDKLNGCSSEADYRRFVRAPVKGRASVAAAFDAVAVDTNNINAITVVATRIDLPSANTPFTPRSSTTTHKVICHRTTQLRCSRPVLL